MVLILSLPSRKRRAPTVLVTVEVDRITGAFERDVDFDVDLNVGFTWIVDVTVHGV